MLRLMFAVLFVASSAWSVLAADLTGKIQERYDTLDSFRAFFLQKLTNASSKEVQERLGSIAFAKPHFIRWETTSPEPEILIIGQDMVWDYFPEEETAYRYSVTEVLDSKIMIRFLSGEANLKEDFIIEDLGLDNALIHLKLMPKEPEPSLVEGEIWVHPEQYMIERIKFLDFFGNENDLELTGIEQNVAMRSDEFSFTPPQGIDILEGPLEQ